MPLFREHLVTHEVGILWSTLWERLKCVWSPESRLREMWTPVLYFVLVTNIDTFSVYWNRLPGFLAT